MKVFLKIVFYPITLLLRLIKRRNLKKQFKVLRISAIDSLTGYQFENFISSVFFAYGYNSKVTPKGADKGVDITAIKHRKKVAIQTKMYYNNNVGNSAIQQIYTAKEYFNADIAVVVTNWFFTKPAIELATKLNVILINRTILESILGGQHINNYIKLTN